MTSVATGESFVKGRKNKHECDISKLKTAKYGEQDT